MGYLLTDDERAIKEALERYLKDKHDISTRIAKRNPVSPQRLWDRLATEIGVPAVAFPLDHDGIGRDLFCAGILLTELGRALVSAPATETIFTAAALFSRLPLSRSILRAIPTGEMTLALAICDSTNRKKPVPPNVIARYANGNWWLDGVVSSVAYSPSVTDLLVAAQDTNKSSILVIVSANTDGLSVMPKHSIDSVPNGDVSFHNSPLNESCVLAKGAEADILIEYLHNIHTLGLCAEGVGVLDAMLDQTKLYMQTRQQFGAAISSFQALRHRLADMFISFIKVEAIVEETLRLASLDNNQLGEMVSVAKIEISMASRIIREGAIQIHGAMGLTEELAISHYFKRALAIAHLNGDEWTHLRQYQSATA